MKSEREFASYAEETSIDKDLTELKANYNNKHSCGARHTTRKRFSGFENEVY